MEAETEGQVDYAKQIEELSTRLKKQDEEMAQLRRDNIMMTMRAPAPAPAAATTAREPELDLVTGMPDPDQDYKAYATEQQKRITAHNRAYAQWVRDQAAAEEGASDAATGRDQAIVSQFREKYPGYSMTGAMAIAGQVIAGMKAKGVDENAYVYGHTDMFLADVAAAYEKEFGKPAPRGEASANGKERARSPEPDPDAEALRTMGVFGGNESGSAPSGATAEAVKEETFTDILGKGQAKTGLFWT